MLHGTGIFTYIWLNKRMVNVSKYSIYLYEFSGVRSSFDKELPCDEAIKTVYVLYTNTYIYIWSPPQDLPIS